MLDFTKTQKKSLPVKLYDGTTLLLTMPKKRTFEKMLSMQFDESGEMSPEAISDVYSVAAEILSSNTRKKEYTPEAVGEMFDLEDLTLLLDEYMDFAGDIAQDPN